MWIKLSSLDLTTNWQVVPVVSSTTFKIKHNLNGFYNNAVAIVALVNDSTSPIEIFEPKKIIARQEVELIKFSKIYGWEYKLAIKQIQLPNKPLANWSIDIFTSNLSESDSITKVPSDLKLQSSFNNSRKLILAAFL